jgi:hypothetical protein
LGEPKTIHTTHNRLVVSRKEKKNIDKITNILEVVFDEELVFDSFVS